MKVWMVFVQEPDADGTWLQAAWDDERTANDYDGWMAVVDEAAKYAAENGYAMRVMEVEVPGVYAAFEVPSVKATVSVVDTRSAQDREEGVDAC